jgi:hypothetical protein
VERKSRPARLLAGLTSSASFRSVSAEESRDPITERVVRHRCDAVLEFPRCATLLLAPIADHAARADETQHFSSSSPVGHGVTSGPSAV